jgi:hypothetical protein
MGNGYFWSKVKSGVYLPFRVKILLEFYFSYKLFNII